MSKSMCRASRASFFSSIVFSACLIIPASLFGMASSAQASTNSECADQTFVLAIDTFNADYNARPWQSFFLRWRPILPLFGVYAGVMNEDGDYSRELKLVGRYESIIGRYSERGILDATGAQDLLASAAELAVCITNIGVEEPVPFTESGLYPLTSSDDEREYYLQLPGDYDDGSGISAAALGDDTRKPLLFLYHGYTGSYENWIGENRFYDMVDVVGDDAIIVVPNGLPDASGKRVWGGDKDELFFLDILAELDERGLQYNPNKIFVAGHSNGAGFTHELGCAYGDVIRGIATAAGALTSTDCVGSIGALLMQGINDPLTNLALALGSVQYWVLYNGWELDQFVPAAEGPCNDYSFPGELNSPYPPLFCLHTQGHDWPDFGSQTVWDFFQGLEEVEPTLDSPLPPPDGGSERATPPSDTTLTFQIDAPADMNRPVRGAASLRPLSWLDTPTCSSPDVILGDFVVDGKVVPGEVSEPITIPITYNALGGLEFPSEVALSLTVYVEGGGTSVIPTPGVDHDTSVGVMLISRETPLVVSEVLTLAPIPDLCGF